MRRRHDHRRGRAPVRRAREHAEGDTERERSRNERRRDVDPSTHSPRRVACGSSAPSPGCRTRSSSTTAATGCAQCRRTPSGSWTSGTPSVATTIRRPSRLPRPRAPRRRRCPGRRDGSSRCRTGRRSRRGGPPRRSDAVAASVSTSSPLFARISSRSASRSARAAAASSSSGRPLHNPRPRSHTPRPRGVLELVAPRLPVERVDEVADQLQLGVDDLHNQS